MQHTFALSLSWLFLIKSLAKLGLFMLVQVCTKDRLCGPWCCPQGFEFSKKEAFPHSSQKVRLLVQQHGLTVIESHKISESHVQVHKQHSTQRTGSQDTATSKERRHFAYSFFHVMWSGYQNACMKFQDVQRQQLFIPESIEGPKQTSKWGTDDLKLWLSRYQDFVQTPILIFFHAMNDD